MKQPINSPGTVSPQKTERIIERLWHGEPAANTKKRIVYTVLDGARNRKLYPLLEQSGVQYYCLYEGPLDYSLTRAAPYLVRL